MPARRLRARRVSSAAFAAAERSPDNRRHVRALADDVRGFFVEARRKRGEGLPLTPLETIAADWIEAHPEYAADLADAEAARAAVYPARGRPREPVPAPVDAPVDQRAARDRPAGAASAQAFELLAARLGSAHAAQHEVMECLGTMLWEAQRSGRPPDGAAYVDCVRRRATR